MTGRSAEADGKLFTQFNNTGKELNDNYNFTHNMYLSNFNRRFAVYDGLVTLGKNK